MKRKFSSMSNMDVVKKYLAGERPYVTVNFNPDAKTAHRVEGEEWEIKGIKYKKVNGKTVKLTETQGDIIRKAIDDALDCTLCGANWKFASTFDRKYLLRTGLCSDCLINHETKLRVLGIYDQYEKYRLASYELGHLKETKIKLDEVIDYFNRTDGNVTLMAESEYDPNIVWKNTNKDQILKDATADIATVKELIKKGNKFIKEYKKQYLDSIAKYNLPDITIRKKIHVRK